MNLSFAPDAASLKAACIDLTRYPVANNIAKYQDVDDETAAAAVAEHGSRPLSVDLAKGNAA